MLQAMKANGTLLTISTATKKEVMEWKKEKMEFYCPVCKEKVMMKAGVKNIAHFAHYQDGNCVANEGGEGGYHEKGKLLLYEWLKKQQVDAQLEVYIPSINQRPDILMKWKGRKIAIEFQCANMSLDLIYHRNAGYIRAGIPPIWILGMNQFQRQAAYHFKLNQFLLRFIHQFSTYYPLTLYFFCPENQQMLTIQDLYIHRVNQAIGKFTIRHLRDILFTDLFSARFFEPHELFTIWLKEKHRFRRQQSNRLYGRERAWYQWLYLKGLHRETLPSLVYLPVTFQMRMKTPLYEWQSRLLLDYIFPLPVGARFSIASCHSFLRSHQQFQQSFLLLKSPVSPVQEYLDHLVILRILEKANDLYVKVRDIKQPMSMEKALAADRAVMSELIKQNSSMITG